jgi:hypothetical protein
MCCGRTFVVMGGGLYENSFYVPTEELLRELRGRSVVRERPAVAAVEARDILRESIWMNAGPGQLS